MYLLPFPLGLDPKSGTKQPKNIFALNIDCQVCNFLGPKKTNEIIQINFTLDYMSYEDPAFQSYSYHSLYGLPLLCVCECHRLESYHYSIVIVDLYGLTSILYAHEGI